MSHYANYVSEREGFHVIENDSGFVEFKIQQEECYIRTIYISPGLRGVGHAKDLAERVTEMAKEYGCKYLSSTIYPASNKEQATISLAMQVNFGFKLSSVHENLIILRKEI